jgi:hypothetical protein
VGWNQATGLSRLTDACAPLWTTHQAPGPAEAAALRAVALALADGALADSASGKGASGEGASVKGASGKGAAGADAPGILRSVAATVTLAERRAKGESPAGEAIILALS